MTNDYIVPLSPDTAKLSGFFGVWLSGGVVVALGILRFSQPNHSAYDTILDSSCDFPYRIFA